MEVLKPSNEHKYYTVDFDKVNTIEDIKDILKTIDLVFNDCGDPNKLNHIKRMLKPYRIQAVNAPVFKK